METRESYEKPQNSIKDFNPGYFTFVMATDIVSIACHLMGMERIATALFNINKAGWAIIFIFYIARLIIFPAGLAAETWRERGASLFTIVAGTCVLGKQYVIISHNFSAALPLWIAGLLSWALLIYTFFITLVARVPKEDPMANGFDGSWLIFIVGTQSVAILGALLSEGYPGSAEAFLFSSLLMYLFGSMLYIIMIVLIFYRMFFFAMPPEKLSPAYWINMGAASITTLSGALILQNSGRWSFLIGIAPFLKGSTLFFWAVASWWIPLLAALFVWKHLLRKEPLSYDVRHWTIVFPLGMYTVCTYRFGNAVGLEYLAPIASGFIYVALVAWVVVFMGLLKKLFFLVKVPALCSSLLERMQAMTRAGIVLITVIAVILGTIALRIFAGIIGEI